MRARYAVEPLGHYGLAKAKYTHFTSPIRRYADLVVHRALFQASHGPTHSLKETAEHISDTERNSADAERDSKDVKMYAFLKAQLAMPKPPVYPALVIDVRNFGFFVDVPGLAMSGLIHCSSLTDDFYEFDEARGQLTGRRNRRVFRLGDKVEVQIAKVDSFKKQVDFKLARAERTEPGDRNRPPQRGLQRPSERQQQRPLQRSQQRFDDRRPQPAQDRRAPRPQQGQPQRGPQRFQDRQQPRPQSRPQPGQSPRGPSRPPQQKSGQASRPPQYQKPGQFKTQSQSRPTLPNRPSRDAKPEPARPQSGGGNFRAGSARPQIPSSHSRSKLGGRRR